MPEVTVEPRSARMSWEEVHRLEVMMRARATSLAKPAGSSPSCAICAGPLGAAPMRLAGALVHPDCLPHSIHP